MFKRHPNYIFFQVVFLLFLSKLFVCPFAAWLLRFWFIWFFVSFKFTAKMKGVFAPGPAGEGRGEGTTPNRT
ncbi:hypothetical protein, partial [Enterobacter asburiae]